MKISFRISLSGLRGLALISLLSLLFLNPAFAAVENFVPEKVNGNKYDITYFYAIEGEVYGQAAPGVEAVLVNNRPISFDENLVFRTKVSLAEGEKYLTIETRYEGLRFIKKYLVIRHPKAQKTFKVHIPQEEYQKIVEKKPAPAPKKPAAAAKKPAAPTLKTVLTAASPEVVAVTAPVTVTTTVPAIKTPAKSRTQAIIDWFRALFSRKKITTEEAVAVMEREAKEIIRQEAVLIVERDAQKIIEGEARRYIETKVPDKELKLIVEKQARYVLLEKYPDKDILELLKREAPIILKTEIEKIIARDLPAGEGLNIIKNEIRKIVKEEAPGVIEKVARDAAVQEAQKSVDKQALQKAINAAIEREVKKLVDAHALALIKSETKKLVEEKAREAGPIRVTAPRLLSPAGAWAGFDLIIELEPGRILLVKRTNGKFIGHIYYVDKQAWLDLDEISYQEFKDLLEKGVLPSSFDPQNKL